MKANPKSILGRKKASYSFIPFNVLRGMGAVMKLGASKYGRFNWREDKIQATDYADAIERHFIEWVNGSNADEESGEHPLAHIMATCAIVMDAEEHGTLIDDRLFMESKDPAPTAQPPTSALDVPDYPPHNID